MPREESKKAAQWRGSTVLHSIGRLLGRPRTRATLPRCSPSWTVVLLVFTMSRPAGAWLLHEHAALAGHALAQLKGERRERLHAAWTQAAQVTRRFCAAPDASGEKLFNRVPPGDYCVGFPVLTGLAADHSCSPSDLRKTLAANFTIDVLKEAESVEVLMRAAAVDHNENRQIDLWHLHHINLQIADPQYLSRAEDNGAHFQLWRFPGEDLRRYLARMATPSTPVNAIALYLHYHANAILLAQKAVQGCTWVSRQFQCPEDTSPPSRNDLFNQSIMTEAFALHFLEDAFSSGHTIATSGSRAQRMGTHDYYCQHGVAVTTWRGTEYTAHGDAFLGDDDIVNGTRAVVASLEQLADALAADSKVSSGEQWASPAEFDACRAETLPLGIDLVAGSRAAEPLQDVARPMSLPPGLPSFTKELGVFYQPLLGVAARVGAEDIAGSARDRWLGGSRLPIAAYLGIGLGVTFEGITDATTDGVVSVGAALLMDGRPAGSTNGLRLGGGVMWHVPYLLVPGDLALLAPIAAIDAFTGGDAYFRILRRSAAGGLLGLQRKHSVGLWGWKLQFVAGREGLVAFMPPPERPASMGAPGSEPAIFSLSGTPGYVKMAFPIFDLTTFHSSSTDVGLDCIWQLGYDITYYTRDESSIAGASKSDVLHGLFFGFTFRSRRYFVQP